MQLGMAQTSGTISGIVHDASGALIPGASVTVKNVDTGLTREIVSDEQGRYSAPNLPVGPYEVQVSLTGFQTEVRSGIGLTVGREAVVNFTMQVGQVSEKVAGTGEAPVVETTNATITGLVDQNTIRDLPLNGRSFTDLMTLQVGTALARNAPATGVLQGGAKISVSGVRPSGNSFLMDGTDINDSRNVTPGGATGLTLGVDTVREFRVLTNSFSAEYGRVTGAVLTAVTKSGTDDLHGSAFEFFRNSALDAAKWEDNARGTGRKAPLRRNQFGGTLGGPIKKDKTFFFAGYEGLQERRGVSNLINVPNALAHQGIIPNNGAVGAPLVNVGIAAGVKPWLDLYPLPNGTDLGNGTGQFTSITTTRTSLNQFMARVDHSFSSKQSIFGRYTFDDSLQNTPNALPIAGGTAISTDHNVQRNQYLTLQWDSILSPVTLNTFRFGMNRSAPRESLIFNPS